MPLKHIRLAAFILCAATGPLHAWNDTGHMTVAYIAYQNLTPETKTRVDALLKLNPRYKTWTKGVSASQRGLVAFLNGATWPDCIKQKCPGYTADGTDHGDTPPPGPEASQNIGYDDKFMHKYWHFVDKPYATGDVPGKDPKNPNAETEIVLLQDAIAGNESDPIKSYDVVWLEHLVGDIHQPLHCASRFTKNHPDGDAGGNLIKFVSGCPDKELHAHWDGLLGKKSDTAAVTKLGKSLLAGGKPAGADDSDVDGWATASFELAKSLAYASPISDDNDPSVTTSPCPDAAYDAAAVKTARAQVTLGGYRLANLLNTKLK
jgi:hypothetical protein